VDTFKVIAFTHKKLPLELLGKLHLSGNEQEHSLMALKVNFDLDELVYLSTCNRIELWLRCRQPLNQNSIREMVLFLNSRITSDEATQLSENAESFNYTEAVDHVLKVACSLDSMVVGEREIVTQVRKAYDFCNFLGLTGDFMRLLIKQAIETAKDVYTNTDIAKNPVSVASLAYRQLRHYGMKNDARILFIGSGETNTILANYFRKHEYANFTVFNRTLANAEKLAGVLGGKAYELSGLSLFSGGFDVLVVCTASTKPVVTEEFYESLLAGEQTKKVIIDLGVPANVSAAVAGKSQIHYINISSLKEQADANMQLRRNEMLKCEAIIHARTDQFYAIHKERRLELAFGEVPRQVKLIRELAMKEVFAKEVGAMDDGSREVLDRVLDYMEKKYNAVAIKTAKEVFLEYKIQRKQQD
jgi:glutamyl-tRNA reductase